MYLNICGVDGSGFYSLNVCALFAVDDKLGDITPCDDLPYDIMPCRVLQIDITVQSKSIR